jgi:hypothetical protein
MHGPGSAALGESVPATRRGGGRRGLHFARHLRGARGHQRGDQVGRGAIGGDGCRRRHGPASRRARLERGGVRAGRATVRGTTYGERVCPFNVPALSLRCPCTLPAASVSIHAGLRPVRRFVPASLRRLRRRRAIEAGGVHAFTFRPSLTTLPPRRPSR